MQFTPKRVDISSLGYDLITKSESYVGLLTQPHCSSQTQLVNKLERNGHLVNKKGLYYNLKSYYESVGRDPFTVIPLTFHLTKGLADPAFALFLQQLNEANPVH